MLSDRPQGSSQQKHATPPFHGCSITGSCLTPALRQRFECLGKTTANQPWLARSSREVRIRVPFLLQSILVGEPPPPPRKKGKRAQTLVHRAPRSAQPPIPDAESRKAWRANWAPKPPDLTCSSPLLHQVETLRSQCLLILTR